MPLEPDDPHAAVLVETSDMTPHLVLCIDSSSMSVRTALVRIRSALAAMGLGHDAAGSIELVLAEVLNNIGEHAYRGMDAGTIEVSIRGDGDMLLFRTRDTGIPMPNGNAPAGRAVSLNCPAEEIPEGGFGWHLIRNLTAGLQYSRIGNSNQLTFRMRRDARPIIGWPAPHHRRVSSAHLKVKETSHGSLDDRDRLGQELVQRDGDGH